MYTMQLTAYESLGTVRVSVTILHTGEDGKTEQVLLRGITAPALPPEAANDGLDAFTYSVVTELMNLYPELRVEQPES